MMMSMTANERESSLDDLSTPQIDAPLKMQMPTDQEAAALAEEEKKAVEGGGHKPL